MRVSISEKALWWSGAAVLLFVTLWLLSGVLLPFVVGAAVAYFLDPVVRRMTARGVNRLVATAIVFLAIIGVVAIAVLLLVPAVINQALQLLEAAPAAIENLHAFLSNHFMLNDIDVILQDAVAGLGETIRESGGQFLQPLLASVRNVAGAVFFLVIAPVVAFYLLLDWTRLVARLDSMLPREHAPTIRQIMDDIDSAIAGFVRGQLTVCLILAAYYAIALVLVGLQYGLVVGVVTGLISFIPFIGAIVGGALAIGLALFQFWGDPMMIGIVVGIFAVGQFLEGNILVPRLVGKSVALHPVWLLFALSAFGTLFGFTGILVAVPVAAALGVLVRFAFARYRESPLYKGAAPPERMPVDAVGPKTVDPSITKTERD